MFVKMLQSFVNGGFGWLPVGMVYYVDLIIDHFTRTTQTLSSIRNPCSQSDSNIHPDHYHGIKYFKICLILLAAGESL